MSIFDKLRDHLTGMRRQNDFRKPIDLEIRERKTGETRPYTLDANEEHEMSVTFYVRYWANDVQVSEARKRAERTLANLLYADVLEKVQLIDHAISDGDASAARHWCGEIRSLVNR